MALGGFLRQRICHEILTGCDSFLIYFTPDWFHSTWHSPINDDRYLQLGWLHIESYMPLDTLTKSWKVK